MKQLSRNLSKSKRILMILFLVIMLVIFTTQFYMPLLKDIKGDIFSELSIGIHSFLLLFICFVIYGLHLTFRMCDVKSDGEYLYIKNFANEEKIHSNNIKSFHVGIKGFIIKFKSKTSLGDSIFFRHRYFTTKEVIRYLNEMMSSLDRK